MFSLYLYIVDFWSQQPKVPFLLFSLSIKMSKLIIVPQPNPTYLVITQYLRWAPNPCGGGGCQEGVKKVDIVIFFQILEVDIATIWSLCRTWKVWYFLLPSTYADSMLQEMTWSSHMWPFNLCRELHPGMYRPECVAPTPQLCPAPFLDSNKWPP
jgi:hypothetical protein